MYPRYSATHSKHYNLVYSLNPVEAYEKNLVKQIEVDSIVTDNDFNDAYVKLDKVFSTKTKCKAKLTIDINKNTDVIRKSITVYCDDDLYNISNKREMYKTDYIINEIDINGQSIKFSNGKTIKVGKEQGALTDKIMKYQIRKTIREHLDKEKQLKEKGIKTLSLFFIDKVVNYRKYSKSGELLKGKFALWFEETFKEFVQEEKYKALIPFPVDKIHNGYFAQDKKGKLKDSQKTARSKDDINTFKLIMKDKEKLLDINEPLRFIFTHSALKEGWDNPNVFQICTLNETTSEMKKRQEIGRGLRLPVNQNGERIFDKNINILTVIANESYEDFAKQLQKEIETESGVKFEGLIKNKRDRVKVNYKKGFELDEKFKEIWKKIKHHTIYRVKYETTAVIDKASKKISEMDEIKKLSITSKKARFDLNQTGINTTLTKTTGRHYITSNNFIPDILSYIQGKTGLTKHTIDRVLNKANRIKDFKNNPQLFMDEVSGIINDVLKNLMIDGIKYSKIADKEYEMKLFEDFDIFRDSLTFEVGEKKKTIYDNLIPLDSNVELQFAKDCETDESVKFYFKLPHWFKIKTPIGNYNPDWALIKGNDETNDKTIYFVAETKSKGQELRQSEENKIKCGEAHFREFKDVEFRQVSSIFELN